MKGVELKTLRIDGYQAGTVLIASATALSSSLLSSLTSVVDATRSLFSFRLITLHICFCVGSCHVAAYQVDLIIPILVAQVTFDFAHFLSFHVHFTFTKSMHFGH